MHFSIAFTLSALIASVLARPIATARPGMHGIRHQNALLVNTHTRYAITAAGSDLEGDADDSLGYDSWTEVEERAMPLVQTREQDSDDGLAYAAWAAVEERAAPAPASGHVSDIDDGIAYQSWTEVEE